MPFVTEEIYMSLPHTAESINCETWPSAIPVDFSSQDRQSVSLALSIISKVREIKQEYNLKPSESLSIDIVDENGAPQILSDYYQKMIDRMCHVHFETITDEEVLTRTLDSAVLKVRMGDLVDLEEEKTKLEKEIGHLQKEIQRAEGMLKNQNFIAKAPKAKVAQERDKLEMYIEKLSLTQTSLEDVLKKLNS